MKIKLRGFVYRSKKLRMKKHYCTTCDAYRCLRTCNEIRSAVFSKDGKTCEHYNVVWKSVGTYKEEEDVLKDMNALYFTRDKYLYSILSNFLEYTTNLFEELYKEGHIPLVKICVLRNYVSKIKLAFHIRAGDKNELD